MMGLEMEIHHGNPEKKQKPFSVSQAHNMFGECVETVDANRSFLSFNLTRQRKIPNLYIYIYIQIQIMKSREFHSERKVLEPYLLAKGQTLVG